jgi:hypothetical protein
MASATRRHPDASPMSLREAAQESGGHVVDKDAACVTWGVVTSTAVAFTVKDAIR